MQDRSRDKAGLGAQRAFYTLLRSVDFLLVSGAKPLKSLKNSSDSVKTEDHSDSFVDDSI